MPTEKDILTVLASEMAPLHRNKIAEMVGETSYRPIQTQLNRLVEKREATVTPDHEYSVTEAGKNRLAEQTIVAEETDEEKLGTTEYQVFIHKGKMTGVSPPELISQTAQHVWDGGDYDDLDWVAKAFKEMGIRKDLAGRWWNSWRSYLRQPIPTTTAKWWEEVKLAEDKSGKSEAKKGRTHILDENDKPVYVGEGLGDMSESDAVDLSKIRGLRGKTMSGAPQTPGSMADEMIKMFNAFQTFMGEKAQGKSYMVRPGEEGIEVEEVDPGRPMVLNYPQGETKQKPTYFVNSEGEVQEVQPGQPIIIKQPAAQLTGGVQYLVDKQTGQVTQVQPGQPIVIQATPPQQQYAYTPIQMTDKDGKPMVLDLSTFIRLEEHRDKQRRDDESHEAKMEIAKGFKEFLGKAAAALGHTAEKK